MAEKNFTMTYDNKQISGGGRVEVTVSHNQLEIYAKEFFNWRGATKHYKSVTDRVFSLGSRDYDNLIEFIAKRKGIIK